MLHFLHQNDREILAQQLQLDLPQFDYLLQSANRAYSLIKQLGPFYGKEENSEPTFRITAEPVRLPIGSKELLYYLGQDIFHLAKALQKLPASYKLLLGEDLDFRLPITFRIDAIITENNKIFINEIEGVDGVSALIMVEQLAYHLQNPQETSIGKLVSLLQKMYPRIDNQPIFIASMRSNLDTNPFTANARRFVEIITELSKGTIAWELHDVEALTRTSQKPNWNKYAAIVNEAYCTPRYLQKLGVPIHKLIAAGNHNAIINKGVFALVHDAKLQTFWGKELGGERWERLKQILIKSKFVTTPTALQQARADGKVAKVTWTPGDSLIMNQSRGVALSKGDLEASQNERWELLKDCLKENYRIIAQEYVEPAKIFAFLRKRGTTLEPVDWYNRVCVKYVADDDPNKNDLPHASLTDVEVTLGPDIIPAGRRCAFTAGSFS